MAPSDSYDPRTGAKKNLDTGAEDVFVFPASFAQERLWFLNQLEPSSPFYNMSGAYILRGPLDVGALEQSLNEILRRQEALRTTFAIEDEHPVQVIAAAQVLTLPVIDLQDLSETERESQTLRVATEEGEGPFDLGRGPLLRAKLLRLGEEEHVLLLTIHHIVCDGWSVEVLFRELAVLYQAFSTGSPSPLPDLPFQYADFAQWQREWLTGEVLEKQLSYWKQQLQGAPALLELPTDRARPAAQTFRGARYSLMLSKALAERLNALSRREGVTRFMTLLTAFQMLLSRYTGQEDILVGCPIAGRNRQETEGLIGFFVNTLVLRTDLSGDPTFRQLLGRVREVALGAYSHQDLPFEKLVEELQPARTLSHTPLFQVIFSLQNASTQTRQLPGLTMTPLRVDRGTSQFDLILDMAEKAEGLSCLFTFSTALFDAATIARMGGHFRTLLEGIVVNPDQRLSELSLLTEAERHQLFVEWNGTKSDYPRSKCIHQLFEAQVERTPEVVAVEFEGERLTYRELNRRANQLAHHLRGLGVGPDVLVGVCVERSLEMVVGLLGILKAGGAYLPLDPGYPKERLAFMLQDANVSLLLTQQRPVESLSEHRARVVCLDTGWDGMAQASEENLCSGVTTDNLAYVIYTSGSTGRPKGVSVPHRAVNRLVLNTNYVALDSSDRVAQASNACFDAATFEIWGALLHGARLVGVSKDVALSPREFAALLREKEISVLFLTTDLLNQFVSELPGAFHSVRHLLFGGSAVDPRWIRELLKHGPPRRLLHVYGPTESTTFTSWHLVQDVPEEATTIPIGRAIGNTQIYLLDRHLNPLPVGVPGELHIGGDGLAREYLNRPELTAEKFIPNPFSEEPGARLYKTGDLARYRPDGSIEFLGRLDDQVKIRGFRVEPGEIEAVLNGHSGVREAVVVAREDAPGEKRLVAYVVPESKERPLLGQLRAHLQQRLPEYMVPSGFVLLEALPLLPSGKVNRHELPAPDRTRPELERRYVAPRDTLERQLTEIWERVIGVHPIGARDNFFELGGHSLLAVRLFVQIEKFIGKKLPLATVFQAPTVEQLAGKLREEGWAEPWSSLVLMQGGGKRPPFFCVPGVGGNILGLYDLARHLGPDQPVYGLQAQGLDGKQEPHTRVEDMAAHYIKEIGAVLPEGPFLLGGASFGGKVAFEMARQLHAAGHKVALVALFDTFGRGSLGSLPKMTVLRHRLKNYRIRIAFHMRNLLYQSERRTYIRKKSRTLMRRIRSRIWQIIFKSYQRMARPLPRALRNVREAGYLASKEYRPKIYPGRVTLFRAGVRSIAGAADYEMGWGKLANGGVDVREVPGDHVNMLVEPHVQILAQQLRDCIDRAMEPEAEADKEAAAASRLAVLPSGLQT